MYEWYIFHVLVLPLLKIRKNEKVIVFNYLDNLSFSRMFTELSPARGIGKIMEYFTFLRLPDPGKFGLYQV